jgi:hypothetical protein
MRREKNDRMWKVIHPRWPKSEDGQWYWKCDTSSDELDGHFFFYALYYDLVAESEEEKNEVRKVVGDITDHFIENDFSYIDWDGKPTRWGVFSPKELNHNPNWYAERGLNSLSILTYLSVAEHVCGDPKYREAADKLIREHSYHINLQVAKIHNGPGGGNQSDDEMAFMNYYNLVRYEKNPELKQLYAYSLRNYWQIEAPELNPFFNFVYAAGCNGLVFDNQWGPDDLEPTSPEWVDESISTLLRFPLDRHDWAHRNSHRTDIRLLDPIVRTFPRSILGYRNNGKVIPVDETYFHHWNCDPWTLDIGGSGIGLAHGTVFLLPYYMGLYHEFITHEQK